ncbi:hypothetical protein Tco_0316356 [Tanacetum coccineum]
MESNKSIYRSNEQKNLYKALVEAYESDKLILDTYCDTVSFKRCRDDKDKDEEPYAGSNQGSKRRRAGKEPKLTSASKEKTSKTTCKSTDGNLAREEGSHESFDELMDTPLDFSAFMMNRLKIDTLTPELLAGLTFVLMKGQQYPHDLRKPLPLIPNSRGRQVIPSDHFINNDLAYLSGGVSSHTYATFVTKTKAAYYGHIKWIKDLVPNTIWSEMPLGVESYQKKLNITKPDTYRSDLKRMDTYTAYSNPRGFIYQNKDKKNRLMRIDKLYKFSDGTLDDVQNAFNDRLKGIRMEYLPKTIWRQSDRERAKTMIHAINKQLKSRRIMRSLEKFIGGRPYEGDLRLLQRTI